MRRTKMTKDDAPAAKPQLVWVTITTPQLKPKTVMVTITTPKVQLKPVTVKIYSATQADSQQIRPGLSR